MTGRGGPRKSRAWLETGCKRPQCDKTRSTIGELETGEVWDRRGTLGLRRFCQPPLPDVFARLGPFIYVRAIAPTRALFLSAITTCPPPLTLLLFLGSRGATPHLTGDAAVFLDVSSSA